ncbi:M24 family metallopeptidase [Modicisalibacter radicis]|uniref:M24 family metallopeptidase n=1 Tax=Halomonas sp. EAR18 TaxID=2518972 RepID=UPI00109C597F|nr:Xaa-Pro peptidase family protein [Halomonas sp. EAR18]
MIAIDYAARLGRIRDELRRIGADLMLIDHGELMAWAIGYSVSQTDYRCVAVPVDGVPWMVLRALDVEPCREEGVLEDVVGYADDCDALDVVAASLVKRGQGAAVVALDYTSYGMDLATFVGLRERLPGVRWIDSGGLSDGLRRCKEDAEIERLQCAAAIADGAMGRLVRRLKAGDTARDAAAMAAGFFLRQGADSGDTGPIVKAVGDSGFLHARRLDEPLASGDVLHVELIPKVAHYSARLMRPILIGEDRRGVAAICRQLIEIQDRQFAAMRPGAVARDVDRIARQGVLEAGLRHRFDNVTGYSLGLYTRTPRTSDFSCAFQPAAQWVLEAGMVFHMYLSAAGVAISETVVVRSGGIERLTQTPRRLLHGLPAPTVG